MPGEIVSGQTTEGLPVAPSLGPRGAMGSLVGQLLHTTAVERKTLLAAGAAAGMDLLAAHRRRLDETHVTEQNLSWWPRG